MQFDVVVFVLLKLLVECLLLDWRTLGIRVEVLHVREAHVAAHLRSFVSVHSASIVLSVVHVLQVKAVAEVVTSEVASTVLVDCVHVVIHLVVSIHVDAYIFEYVDSFRNVVKLLLLFILVCILTMSDLCWGQSTEGRRPESKSVLSCSTLLRLLHRLVHLHHAGRCLAGGLKLLLRLLFH